MLKKQLKINGSCEKFTLSEDGTKLFYVDRNKNDIWVVELDNDYLLKNIGSFPNVSKIVYENGKIYITSRTKNRIAIVDYETNGFLSELEVCEKPIDLYAHNGEVFILGAQDNIVEVLNTEDDVITDKLFLNTNAFATKITPIVDSNLIMITNARSGLYSVIDTDLKEVIKTSPLDVPVREIAVTNRVKTIK
jgi:DNA-binding beta-propeller fold protein YncE